MKVGYTSGATEIFEKSKVQTSLETNTLRVKRHDTNMTCASVHRPGVFLVRCDELLFQAKLIQNGATFGGVWGGAFAKAKPPSQNTLPETDGLPMNQNCGFFMAMLVSGSVYQKAFLPPPKMAGYGHPAWNFSSTLLHLAKCGVANRGKWSLVDFGGIIDAPRFGIRKYSILSFLAAALVNLSEVQ